MKKGIVLFFILGVLCISPESFASPSEEYEAAYKIYIAAGASVAAYNNRMGELATHYLLQDGWSIDHYVQPDGASGARFLVATRNAEDGHKIHVIAIVGTETKHDRQLDLQVGKVYFAGRTETEFATNATQNNIPDTMPKVHRGFHKFIQSGPAAVLRNEGKSQLRMMEVLREDKKNKLYLTGHSLGGAAATLTGARLLDMGIAPEQIEVITFGAPAVGNAAFAERFNASLKLTRVVIAGDPVVTVLQGLVGGYRQFGREIKFKLHPMLDDPHYIAGYVDAAMKNYYDKRQVQRENDLAAIHPIPNDKQVNSERVYIAPLRNKLPAVLTDEFRYMDQALGDEYRTSFPNSIQGNSDGSDQWMKKATDADCRWLIVPEVGAVRVRQEKPIYYITVHQSVYDVKTGAVADMVEFSTGTYKLTPLEAYILAFKGIDTHRAVWLRKP